MEHKQILKSLGQHELASRIHYNDQMSVRRFVSSEKDAEKFIEIFKEYQDKFEISYNICLDPYTDPKEEYEILDPSFIVLVKFI
jgi:acetone carboxylase gamma subunit